MNSKYYDVAQSRKRLIWIGCRENSPIFPRPRTELKYLNDVLPDIIEQNRGQYDKTWKTAKDLYGIGKYGDDAWHIFCVGDWKDVEPNDQALNKYHSQMPKMPKFQIQIIQISFS